MTQYANRSGNSGVAAYEIGNDSICVEFTTGTRYLYTYASAGAANIDEMKRLAADGAGLNSFINRVVRKLYASKNC